MLAKQVGGTAGTDSSQEAIGVVSFAALRSDWYVANSAMPRFARRALDAGRPTVFEGFPRQWIPIFEWYGLDWRGSVQPPQYVPFFSDLSEKRLMSIVNKARREGSLRILVESASMYDPIVSDFLYIADNTIRTCSTAMLSELREINPEVARSRKRPLLLNGWQSYGRPSLRMLEAEVAKVKPKSEIAAALPCSLTRPYDHSRTHRKIYRILREKGYDIGGIHRIVITSLGVLPEEVWKLPPVMSYDAGVPDIYRTLRLVRSYFRSKSYACVLDCLQFAPYSDVLHIAEREGVISQVHRIAVPDRRHFVACGFAPSLER